MSTVASASSVGMMAQVTALLSALSGDDNAARQTAEARLASAVKGPAFIVALLQFIDRRNNTSHHDDGDGGDGTVALAAVLLSRHMPNVWGELAPAQKQRVFGHLLQQFAAYESHRVLQCLAELACTVAQSAAGQDDFFWKDLPELALRCSQDRGGNGGSSVACAARRVVSFKLLAMLTDSLGARMVGVYPHIMRAVVAAVAATPDPDPAVRAAALTATAVALGASEFWGDHAPLLLPAYYNFVWKLLDVAERAAGRAIAALFRDPAAAAAAAAAAASPGGGAPSQSVSESVGDAVAVFTALATAIRSAADADSGVLSRAAAAAAAGGGGGGAVGGASSVSLVRKFTACHRRACELCFQVLRRDFSAPSLPAAGTPAFLRGCVLLLGSVVALDDDGRASTATAADGGGGFANPFGSPGPGTQHQQQQHAQLSPTMRGVPLPSDGPALAVVELPKGLFACVKLVAMTLAKEAGGGGVEQVAWSYRDQVELDAEHADIDASDAAHDPAMNSTVAQAALGSIRSLLCGNFSPERVQRLPRVAQRAAQAALARLLQQMVQQAGQALAELRRALAGPDWARTTPGPGLPWAGGVVQRYHMCQAWCLALAAAVESKVAKLEVPRLAQAILAFATFRLDGGGEGGAGGGGDGGAAARPADPVASPAAGAGAATRALLVRLVRRRGTLSLYDLVAGPWSALETGSHFLCRWMLTLLPQIMGLLRQCSGSNAVPGSEAQQGRTLMLLGAVFREQGAFDPSSSSDGGSDGGGDAPAVDDASASQFSIALARQIDALVQQLRSAAIGGSGSGSGSGSGGAAPGAAGVDLGRRRQRQAILLRKLLLKAVLTTLLELLRVSRPAAHRAAGGALLRLVGPLVRDATDARLATAAVDIVARVLPVLQAADPASVPLDQLAGLETFLRTLLRVPDFAAATLRFYAAYAAVLRGNAARLPGSTRGQLTLCLQHAVPAVRAACLEADGSEVKIGSCVRTTVRRGVTTDGLAARRAGLRCLASFARSADAPFAPHVWGALQCVVANREHSDAEVQLCAFAALQAAWGWIVRGTVAVAGPGGGGGGSRPFAQLAPAHVAKAASAMVTTVDGWMVVKQVVTVEHGRMVVKRLVDHDELQQRTAQFVEGTLLRPGGGSLRVLAAVDRSFPAGGVGGGGSGADAGAAISGGGGADAAVSLVGQLQSTLRHWRAEQQQASSDDEDSAAFGGNDDYAGSSDEEEEDGSM